jgi:hypothetical protein
MVFILQQFFPVGFSDRISTAEGQSFEDKFGPRVKNSVIISYYNRLVQSEDKLFDAIYFEADIANAFVEKDDLVYFIQLI